MSDSFMTPDQGAQLPAAATGDNPAVQTQAPAASAPASFSLAAGARTFHNQDDVVKHIEHSQAHITRLEGENAELRGKLTTLEAQLAEVGDLKGQVEALMAQVQGNEQDATNPAKSSQTGATDVKELAAAVMQEIQNTNAKATLEQNFANSKKAAMERFGDKYLENLQQRAAELELTMEDVDRMARERPAAFKQIVLGSQSAVSGKPSAFEEGNRNPPRGTQNPPPNAKPFTKLNSQEKAAEIQRRIAAAESSQ